MNTPRIIWTPDTEPTAGLLAHLANAAHAAGNELYIAANDGVRPAADLLADHDQRAYNDALADWLAQQSKP